MHFESMLSLRIAIAFLRIVRTDSRENLAAASLGNLAFFGGGDGGIQKFNVVDIFNTTSQTWSTATLSQNRTGLAAASIGDIVAFGGGTPDGSTYSAVVDMGESIKSL
jgi:hypothetical protein